MANSKKLGYSDDKMLSSKLLPPRTPGILGKLDAGDPNVKSRQGDTPGSLGINDGASPSKGSASSALKNSNHESQVALDHALQLVADLIRHGNAVGMTTAAELMHYWREGGDDRLGEHRPAKTWKDFQGEEHQGKRLPASLFWPIQKYGLPSKLAPHRTRFIQGATQRLKDGRLGMSQPEVEMVFKAASGNWDVSDLQFALGPCTLHSRVRVRISKVVRAGQELELLPQNKLNTSDTVYCNFVRWEICLSDRYDWVHGRSGSAGFMPLMNLHHFALYGTFKNPQEILHTLEKPYGFQNAEFPRVFARPFDVETEAVVLRESKSPNVDLKQFGSQDLALDYTSLMRGFEVVL